MKNLLTVLVFSLISTVSAFAWDDTGHKVSTEIAWQKMTPAAREKAVAVLTQAPENSGILNLLASDSRSPAARQEAMFYTVSTWADLVRDRTGFPVRNKEYHHGTWHYTDTFWRDVSGRAEPVADLKPDAENAVAELFALDKVLRDTTKPGAERAVALAWILHVAGDIHQPLHCSARVTNEEAKGDQGGNSFLLNKPANSQRPDNLHYYWDSILTRVEPRINDEGDTTYITKLANELMTKFPAQKFAGQMKTGKYDEWQKEGFDLATKEVYPASLKRGEAPSDAYRKRTFEISQERLALAGYRMAEWLNQVFAA